MGAEKLLIYLLTYQNETYCISSRLIAKTLKVLVSVRKDARTVRVWVVDASRGNRIWAGDDVIVGTAAHGIADVEGASVTQWIDVGVILSGVEFATL